MKILIVMGNGRSDDTLGDHAVPINLANKLVDMGVDVTVLANSKDNGTVDDRVNLIQFECDNRGWAKKLINKSSEIYHSGHYDHASYHFSAFSVAKWVSILDDDMKISYVNHSSVMGGISTVRIVDDLKRLGTKPNTKLVFISDFMIKKWKKTIGLSSDDIIPNAISIDNGVTYPDRSKLVPIDKRNGKLIHVGRIDQVKNTKIILEFVRRYDIPTIIIGQPQRRKTGKQEYADDCLKIIKDTECIEYIPWLKNEEVRQLVSESVASINISSYEGMCLALLESLSVGTPILSTTSCKANRQVMTLDGSVPIGPMGEYPDVYRKSLDKRLELMYNSWRDLVDNPRDPYYIYDKSKVHYDISKIARDYIGMFESMM